MHNHFVQIKCEHELKHCEQCDIVYCTKCNKEWKAGVETYKITTWPLVTYPLTGDGVSPWYTIEYKEHNHI